MTSPEIEKTPKRERPMYMEKSAPSNLTIFQQKYMQNRVLTPSTYRKMVNGTLHGKLKVSHLEKLYETNIVLCLNN